MCALTPKHCKLNLCCSFQQLDCPWMRHLHKSCSAANRFVVEPGSRSWKEGWRDTIFEMAFVQRMADRRAIVIITGALKLQLQDWDTAGLTNVLFCKFIKILVVMLLTAFLQILQHLNMPSGIGFQIGTFTNNLQIVPSVKTCSQPIRYAHLPCESAAYAHRQKESRSCLHLRFESEEAHDRPSVPEDPIQGPHVCQMIWHWIACIRANFE